MIRTLRKTGGRTSRFLGDALTWRPSERQYAVLAWGLVAGAIWFAVGPGHGSGGLLEAIAACYLLILLASISAIDARFGIIPNSLVLGLASGGLVQAYFFGAEGLWWRGLEAVSVLLAAALFRAGYRLFRGHDGLGLGDVKFLGAAALWAGLGGVPVLLLIAVLSALISLLILRSEGYALRARQAIAFGPHLCIGLWWVWLLG